MRSVFSRLSRVHACVPIKAIEPFSLLVCRSIRFASAHSSVHRRWAASAIFSVLFWKGFIITYVQGRNINASSLIGVDSITPNFQVNLNVRRWFFKWSYISQTYGFLLLSQRSIKVRSHDQVWTRGKRLTELEPAVGTITTNFVLSWSSALPLCNEPSWKTIEQALVCCHWKSGCVVSLSRNFALK